MSVVLIFFVKDTVKSFNYQNCLKKQLGCNYNKLILVVEIIGGLVEITIKYKRI